MSTQQKLVPSAWKLAHVSFIFKGKGSNLNVENYRPISLTNVFCKQVESLIRNKILEFLYANELISPSQSGFKQAGPHYLNYSW